MTRTFETNGSKVPYFQAIKHLKPNAFKHHGVKLMSSCQPALPPPPPGHLGCAEFVALVDVFEKRSAVVRRRGHERANVASRHVRVRPLVVPICNGASSEARTNNRVQIIESAVVIYILPSHKQTLNPGCFQARVSFEASCT